MTNAGRRSIRPAVCAVAVLICTATASAAEKPVVFWASDPVRPNETVMLQGSGFGRDAVVEIARTTEDVAGSPGVGRLAVGKWWKVKPLQAGGHSVKFIVPKDWKMGVYACRVLVGGKTSETRFLNAPDVWWIQGDQGTVDEDYNDYTFGRAQATCTPGGWLRVFGRCLNFGGQSLALLRSAGGKDITLKADKADCYSLSLAVPKDIAPGSYDV